MDITDIATQIQSELDKRSAALDAKDAELSAASYKLAEFVKQNEDKKQELDIRETSISEREKVAMTDDERAARLVELNNKLAELEAKKGEIAKEENDLAEKYATVKQAEDAVAARERTVSDKEINYKEDLKKEFVTQLSKYTG